MIALSLIFLTTDLSGQYKDLQPQVLPPQNLEHFTFGYRLPMADSLWLRVLQNSDFCESPNTEKAYNAGIELDEVLKYKMKPSRCHKGWVFSLMDKASDLDPRFRIVYSEGGTHLSIGVDDREGARIILDKGVEQFPNDWTILYKASYHYLFEIQDKAKAAELMARASKEPGSPPFLPSLAARLFTLNGQLDLGKQILIDYLKDNETGEGADRARMRLKELEAKEASGTN